MNLTDTILATSSPPISAGKTTRSILRLSGPGSWPAACQILPLKNPAVGIHTHLPIPLVHSTAPLASLLLFRSPKSFTGDDIAELHLPASPALLRTITDELLRQPDTRVADPGEFSARAFFHGKIDLTQAEGIAATISATNTIQLRAAAGLREGALHKEMLRLTDKVANILALVEAGIDFTDEEGISSIDADQVADTLEQLGERLHHLVAESVRVDQLDRPPTVVLLGDPNVGKSSLINALTGQPRAIVSNIAGTTRDMLAATLHSDKGAIRLVDVPGEELPTDELRAKMMEARSLAILDADLVIEVIDHTKHPGDFTVMSPDHDFPCPWIVVQNKVDLHPAPHVDEGWWLPGTGKPWGQVSAHTGLNIDKLRTVIATLAIRTESAGSLQIALNGRHRSLLKKAQWDLWTAADFTDDSATFHRHPELLAAELRAALDTLGQITGAISPDEILGRIFSSFCIGK